MTTIACDGKTMAADSCCISEHLAPAAYRSSKLYRIGRSIYGEAGDAGGSGKLLQWLRQRASASDPDGVPEPIFEKHERDFAVLELSPDGIFVYEKDCIRNRVLEPRAAIGSGSLVALYVMRQGKGAEEAVFEACTVDDGSRPPVSVEKL